MKNDDEHDDGDDDDDDDDDDGEDIDDDDGGYIMPYAWLVSVGIIDCTSVHILAKKSAKCSYRGSRFSGQRTLNTSRPWSTMSTYETLENES